MTLRSDTCPNCSTSLVSEPIPELERTDDRTHATRAIAHDYPGVDATCELECPDCGYREDGFTSEPLTTPASRARVPKPLPEQAPLGLER